MTPANRNCQLHPDSRAGWQTGGNSGPALIPGHPEMPLLIQAIFQNASIDQAFRLTDVAGHIEKAIIA